MSNKKTELEKQYKFIFDDANLILTKSNKTLQIKIAIEEDIKNWDEKDWSRIAKSLSSNETFPFKIPLIDNIEIIEKYNTNINAKGLIVLPYGGFYPNFRKNFLTHIEAIASSPIQLALALVFDGPNNDNDLEFIISHLSHTTFPSYVLQNKENCGYVSSIKSAVDLLDSQKEYEYFGFLDDDANIHNKEKHYEIMLKHLENSEVYAVSGLASDISESENVFHSFVNIPNQLNIFTRARNELGIDYRKPHVHGGGGGCLTKREYFLESLAFSLKNGKLLGPSMSAIARTKKMKAYATSESLVQHPTKNKFIEWFLTGRKYDVNWNSMNKILPNNDVSIYLEYLKMEEEVFKKLFTPDELEKYAILKEFRMKFKYLEPINGKN